MVGCLARTPTRDSDPHGVQHGLVDVKGRKGRGRDHWAYLPPRGERGTPTVREAVGGKPAEEKDVGVANFRGREGSHYT